ncbi:HK97 family phage prohead protease [Jeongeupia sp. USM3]|uniref:HK97 family phage prohead protease n=1 Tax=Jeongeupia sp. USM3 TaxID=1906741 RepID=UPI00089E0541|nr:HK97 family phage prohead protease [Jeongeupia sp. USM3]AOY00109.1 hypothetical protein BJP62_06375 [Jeongeupia sp. USM3]
MPALDHLDFGIEIKAVREDGFFSGYGSVFDVVDSYWEKVAPGAFADSLKQHDAKGSMPAMLWQHRSGEPIGRYKLMREDSVGLYLEGQLAIKTARGAEAYELLQMKAISGLSIGFVTREDSVDKVSGIRTLSKLDLWEVSLVTFPANDSARINGVKGIDAIQTLSDAERYLREAGGFSRHEATAFASRFKSLAGQRDAGEDMAALQNLIKSIRS